MTLLRVVIGRVDIVETIIFTDLDASLLDEDTFSCFEILETIYSIKDSGVLLIPNTSKTEVETKKFLNSLNIEVPYIIENGAKFCDVWRICGSIKEINVEFGISVMELDQKLSCLTDTNFYKNFELLDTLPLYTQIEILGLDNSSIKDAMARRYSRLFKNSGVSERIDEWCSILSRKNLSFVEGGRVCSLSGLHDKSTPMKWLLKSLRSKDKRLPIVIAIGDGKNDQAMFSVADIACVIPRKNGFLMELPDHPCVVYAEEPAPFGWQASAKKALEIAGAPINLR